MKRTPLRRKTPLKTKTPLKSQFWAKSTKKASKKSKKVQNSVKTWSTATADARFSTLIRQRDGSCRRCETTESLTCSHYWRRGHSATRFALLNCITLCASCHSEWEHQKNNEYREYMLSWLGESLYTELERTARSFCKRSDAVMALKTRIEQGTFTHTSLTTPALRVI